MIRLFTLRAIRDFDSGVALHAQWNQIIAFEIRLFTDTCLRRHVGGYWSVAKVSAKILSFLPQKQIEASQIAGHYGKGKFWFTFIVSHFSFSNFFKLEFSKEKFGKLRGVLLLCFCPKKHYTWFQKLTDLQRIFRYLLLREVREILSLIFSKVTSTQFRAFEGLSLETPGFTRSLYVDVVWCSHLLRTFIRGTW